MFKVQLMKKSHIARELRVLLSYYISCDPSVNLNLILLRSEHLYLQGKWISSGNKTVSLFRYTFLTIAEIDFSRTSTPPWRKRQRPRLEEEVQVGERANDDVDWSDRGILRRLQFAPPGRKSPRAFPQLHAPHEDQVSIFPLYISYLLYTLFNGNPLQNSLTGLPLTGLPLIGLPG